MVLVEPRQIEKWKKTMTDKTVSVKDALHRDIAENEKAKLYSDSLRRYLNISKPEVEKKFNEVESLVLETVPKRWKTHASKLLSHLKSNPNVDWNAKGELVLNDAPIAKSHIVDLVNDLMRKRTTTSAPTGWIELAKVLKDSNVPHELIGNEDRWQYITSPTSQTSPDASSGKRRRQSSSKIPLYKHAEQTTPKRKGKKPIAWQQY